MSPSNANVVAVDAAPLARDAESLPAGTRHKIARVAVALSGARQLAEQRTDGDDEFMFIIGILELAEAELERLLA